MGGSHGGFLTGHLLGQHPTRFRTGILRNPVLALMHAWPEGLSGAPTPYIAQCLTALLLALQVMDLSVMTHVSDIPDWCYIEAYGVEVGPCTLPPYCQTLPLPRPVPYGGLLRPGGPPAHGGAADARGPGALPQRVADSACRPCRRALAFCARRQGPQASAHTPESTLQQCSSCATLTYFEVKVFALLAGCPW